jgi:hypothetical protein
MSYALAAIALVEYARSHPREDFAFGPLSASAMAENGLTLSGADLNGPAAVLLGDGSQERPGILGLAEYEPEAVTAGPD